jgi:hypothetical protein
MALLKWKYLKKMLSIKKYLTNILSTEDVENCDVVFF